MTTQSARFMSKVQRGEPIHQLDGVPRFTWKGRRRALSIFVMTDLSEVARTGLRVHDQILTGYLSSVGGLSYPIFETFVSRAFPLASGEWEGADPIWERFGSESQPRHKFLAVAIEVTQAVRAST